MLYDPPLYDDVTNITAIVIQKDSPLMSPMSVWTLAEQVVARLVEEDLIIKPERCAYANGPRTVICENDAPLTRQYCYDHGN